MPARTGMLTLQQPRDPMRIGPAALQSARCTSATDLERHTSFERM